MSEGVSALTGVGAGRSCAGREAARLRMWHLLALACSASSGLRACADVAKGRSYNTIAVEGVKLWISGFIGGTFHRATFQRGLLDRAARARRNWLRLKPFEFSGSQRFWSLDAARRIATPPPPYIELLRALATGLLGIVCLAGLARSCLLWHRCRASLRVAQKTCYPNEQTSTGSCRPGSCPGSRSWARSRSRARALATDSLRLRTLEQLASARWLRLSA